MCGCVSDFQETGSAVVGVTDSVIRMIVETSPFTGAVLRYNNTYQENSAMTGQSFLPLSVTLYCEYYIKTAI